MATHPLDSNRAIGKGPGVHSEAVRYPVFQYSLSTDVHTTSASCNFPSRCGERPISIQAQES